MSTPLSPSTPGPTGLACPACGAPYETGASFCEGCGRDLGPVPAVASTTPTGEPAAEDRTAWATADPVTAAAGEESPLDVGWTGPVARQGSTTAGSVEAGSVEAGSEGSVCQSCGEGHVADGYCDVCGSKARDPRDHYVEEPATWVAGVCDIGRRHRRNEDAVALYAQPEPRSFAVLVVCDGVSNTLDSHVASLAASRAARDVLDDPLPRGVGTRTAVVAAAHARLGQAVQAARAAVVAVTPANGLEKSPPSCTIVAAVVSDGVAVVGNVGDSRAYWLPDDPQRPARQLSLDDSFAQEQMAAGVPREQAETGPGAHAITRWLGVDSPDDLTPHTGDLDLDHDGWLLVCSDGLWNYCSDAVDLRTRVHETVAALGVSGHHPLSLAGALTDWANACGGTDNISVALARVGATSTPGPQGPHSPPSPRVTDDPPGIDDTKDTP